MTGGLNDPKIFVRIATDECEKYSSIPQTNPNIIFQNRNIYTKNRLHNIHLKYLFCILFYIMWYPLVRIIASMRRRRDAYRFFTIFICMRCGFLFLKFQYSSGLR